jgi:hypothetical protein
MDFTNDAVLKASHRLLSAAAALGLTGRARFTLVLWGSRLVRCDPDLKYIGHIKSCRV